MAQTPPHAPNNVNVVVVVSGSPTPVQINIHQTLGHLVHDALQRSGNVGQPAADWELRAENGGLLDQSLTVGAAGLHEGQTLFLNPRAGVGG